MQAYPTRDAYLEDKRRWVLDRRREGVEGHFRAQALALPLPPSFHDALRVPRAEVALVAELRRPCEANGRWDVAAEVKRWEEQGATAVAVPTCALQGLGSYEDVLAAAQASSLPVLCQDMVLDPLQVTLARAHGAAAVVLVAEVLEERELRALYRYAVELGLEVVVEVRSALEITWVRKVRLGPSEMSGVRIFVVAPSHWEATPHAPQEYATLSEKLIEVMPDYAIPLVALPPALASQQVRLHGAGYEGFLVQTLDVCPDGAHHDLPKVPASLARISGEH